MKSWIKSKNSLSCLLFDVRSSLTLRNVPPECEWQARRPLTLQVCELSEVREHAVSAGL